MLRTHEPDDLDAVNERLIQELVAEERRLLARPPETRQLTDESDTVR
ncbi:MAG: hypothetical protein N2C12_06380 [Planctomycetales bacterium]